ncbi:MAG TPA: DNA-binding domain-containing protein [Hyphomicrobiales bacterium]|nr:DNA-binding domain-containing protein [Hyphomicrobiales bacterium]
MRDYSADFAVPLLDPGAAVPPGVVGGTRRFGVYRNNVVVGLVEALADAYPIVRTLVGEEFFRAAARLFVLDNPPKSPVMLDYGVGFAEFLEDFEPAERLTYLADVARIERAALDAYHAADAEPLAIATLAAIDPDRLEAVRLVPHPAARVLATRHGAAAVWRAHTDPGSAGPVRAEGDADLVIVRPDADVAAHVLPAGALILFAMLAEGNTLGMAAAAADEVAGFDLQAALVALFAAGAFAAIAET